MILDIDLIPAKQIRVLSNKFLQLVLGISRKMYILPCMRFYFRGL